MQYKMLSRRVLILMTLVLALGVIVAACGTPATPAPAPTQAPAQPTAAPAQPTAAPAEPTKAPEQPTAAPVEPTAAPSGKALKIGVISDVGGVGDKSFNDAAVAGLESAKKDFGLDPASKFLQSKQQTDYSKNIQEFASQGFDGMITVGFLMGVETATGAKANPAIKFAIVDYGYPDCFGTAVEGKDCGTAKALDNVLGLTFKTEEAAFQAGYLAAAMSKSKKVGTFGGLNIPPVVDFMVGFEGGINYWNQKHNDKVELLGWSTAKNDGTFAGSFTDADKGKQITESLIDEGADVVLPVAGQTGLGTFTAAKDKGIYAIGVDVDQCVSVPDACPVLLTSIRKNIDVAVHDAIGSMVKGDFAGGTNYVGTLANNGVSIAPFNQLDSKVPAEVKTELEQLKADIIAGKIDIRALAKGQ